MAKGRLELIFRRQASSSRVMVMAVVAPVAMVHPVKPYMVKPVIRPMGLGSSRLRRACSRLRRACGGVGRALRFLRGGHGGCRILLRRIGGRLRVFHGFLRGTAAEKQARSHQDDQWAPEQKIAHSSSLRKSDRKSTACVRNAAVSLVTANSMECFDKYQRSFCESASKRDAISKRYFCL
jgi:hypothetical protein